MKLSALPVASCLALLSVAFAGAPAARISIVGSATLFPLAATVAERFAQTGHYPAPIVESNGTGGGFQLFCQGAGTASPSIIDASRPMGDEERKLCARNKVGSLLPLRVGSDGILLASARQGPALNLSREQVYRAVARTVAVEGKLVPNPYRKWRDIDARLPDMPIRVFGPAPNHGTRDAFVALVLAPPCERQPEIRALQPAQQRLLCQTVREDGAWIDVPGDYALLLGRLVADPRALGVLGYGFLERNRDRIQAARIDGVAPTVETITSGHYPLSRPLFLYVKAVHLGRVPGLAEFLEEFLSDKAAGASGYLVERGLVAQPASWLALERRKLAAQGSAPKSTMPAPGSSGVSKDS